MQDLPCLALPCLGFDTPAVPVPVPLPLPRPDYPTLPTTLLLY